MDDRIYVAFLVGVGRNCATFGTYSHYKRPAEDELEVRVPSILPVGNVNAILYEIDRAATRISDWRSLYAWLGRDPGTWAAFTQESGLRLLPHWFSESTEFVCKSISVDGNGPFLDVRSTCPFRRRARGEKWSWRGVL